MPEGVLEKVFLDVAQEKGLLSERTRADVESAVARATSQGSSLAPWRAAFVRGFLSRREVDVCLAEASQRSAGGGTASAAEVEVLPGEDPARDARLGQIAVETGLVDATLLDRALAAARGGKKLSDTLVEAGGVSRTQRDSLLILLASVAPGANALEHPLGQDLLFGRIAIDYGFVSARALDMALAEQRRISERTGTDPMIGDILCMQGALTEAGRDLVREMRSRRALRGTPSGARSATRDPDAFGRVIIERGLATQEQVDACVELQEQLRALGIDRRLGDLLVIKGLVNRAALEAALEAQTARRKLSSRRRGGRGPAVETPEAGSTILVGVLVGVVLIGAYSVFALSTGGPGSGPDGVKAGGSPR